MMQRILLAVDASEHAKKAAALAGELGTLSGAEVLVLHFREREFSRAGSFDLETTDEAHDLVDGIVRELKDAGVSARGDVHLTTHGQAANGILTTAREYHPELIVMGSRGLGDLSALLLGSVAHKVLHLADCPVLIAR
jgi:nucleotide-binding universal stress UspA family protein